MDLISDKWLPVVFVDGTTGNVSLGELPDDRIIDVAYPRADFQGAAWQMLAGVMQCAIAPEDEDDWEAVWLDGIQPADWERALAGLAPAFQFGEQKPAFLQSIESLDTEWSDISWLLIDSPGGNTLKLNKDHFVKRDTVRCMCPDCAVMALYCVQTNSPAGGAGYRVGMRGGGPLTTLIVPGQESSFPLWKKIWLNVLPQEQSLDPAQLPLIFPWLSATKVSTGSGNVVTPDNAHPLQAYWGMPRRIELDFTRTSPGICDLCGKFHPARLSHMRSKNYGVQYDGWRHPFSPYRQALKDPSAPWLAFKGQPGGLSYKEWLGLLFNSEDKFNRISPAKVVRASGIMRKGGFNLWCFAYDMDNAKARCWYQHRIPLLAVAQPPRFLSLITLVISLSAGTLGILKDALKQARLARPKDAKMDLSIVDIAFWQETENNFRTLINTLAVNSETQVFETRQALNRWERSLHHYAVQFFDNDVLTDPDCPDDILLRQLTARRDMENKYRQQKVRKDLLALTKEQETEHAQQ